MAINGRINVDVLFHDTDGTASLKVVSLEDSAAYTSGKVAIITGTCGTAASTVAVSPTTYRNAAGDLVSFATVSRVAFSAGSAGLVELAGTGDLHLYSRAGQAAASEAFETSSFSVSTTAGTSAYTLVLYGT